MTEQGTIYIQGWSNGAQELSNFSDIYVSCKYGWKDTSLGTVTQTGTITNKSLTVADSFDFITFEGDSHTITATWDDEQYIGVVPVIYDVILTYLGSSPKLNKLSFDPTNDGWTVIGDCDTVDQGINSGYAIEFSNPQKEIHVETQTDKKALSTTEPYFGTGVIADGAYYDETENTYIVIDGTNHPGQLSFSSTTSWEPSNERNYSKQTSGSMFYMWNSEDITECTALNHYTWDLSDVYLCYDNTTELTVDGNTYTKQNPGPQPAEKHIYLCDNSGAHLAEMTNTGSTWSVSGAFTSGMYSIRATVEGQYEDAWFKFYQTSGDNRVFVGAGDDPSFEDIGTYIMIDDILTSFSLTEDQETGYYVVSYQNTGAMTVSMVDSIVNSYIGDFVTGSEISVMGYMTQTDISSMGYMTQTDISAMGYMTQTDISAMSYVDSTSLSNMSYITMTDVQSLGYIDQTSLSNMAYIKMTDVQGLGYIDQTSLSNMAYVDSTSLSNMSYVDNTYLSTYMNAVVGDINSILQTI